MSSLTTKHCIACKKGDTPLTEQEAETLLKDLPGWDMLEDAGLLIREYAFANFAESLAFVNQVAAIAEAENHHPDIAFGWGYCAISLHTHAINGLHENDFIVAAKINALKA